uniref:Uncharacterized protein n=1 Tax=Timema bartmani TaxID=61472 RepID=A0A7R9EZX2_9NEOP|nr:unnamed protein product [Timema bartmani]
MCKHRILLLAVTWVSVTQGDSVRRKSASRLTPTSERVGPPPGAQFFPIPVIPLPEGVLHKPKPGKRPRPTGPPPPPPLKPENIHTFEAVNSVAQREEGFLKEVEGLENPVVTKRGYYAFRSPEGLYFHVDYVADENGFRASSDPLPESPKISSTQGF